jgi:Na+-translocating ferredoxin:NAD+ oxidoreductase RnfG subunit
LRHGRKLIIFGAVVSLLSAAAYGQLNRRQSGYETFLPDIVPKAATFTSLQTSGSTMLYQAIDATGNEIGFVTAAEGPGYGGPMSVLVAWTDAGVITAVKVPQHHEDLPWWKVLSKKDFFSQYIGRSFSEPLQLNNDVDATTGSTVSSNGVAIGVRSGRLVLAEYLGQPYTGPADPIRIGLPEIAVGFGLLSVVLARTLPGLRRRNWPRVVSLIYGFIVIGVWLSIPLSLTNIAAWLVGYSPHLQTFLVIYLIVFGIIGLAVLFGKNYYCFWLCPYVAVQELFHITFGGRARPDLKWFRILHNTRFILLFVAVFLVLALKNPSVSVFEPWNVLFSLKGTVDQWILMVFVLLAAVFVYNFWCHYLCPVGAVMEIIIKVRKGVLRLWSRNKTPIIPATPPASS